MDDDITRETQADIDPAYGPDRDRPVNEDDDGTEPEEAQLQLTRDLLGGLAGELDEGYVAVEQEGRAHASERYPKTTEAPLWWAAFGGYLQGVFDLVVGEHGHPWQPVETRTLEEQAIANVGLVAAAGGDELAREMAEAATHVPGHWGNQRAYLRGAAFALDTMLMLRRRDVRQANPPGDVTTKEALDELQESADEAAWFEGFGRAVVAASGGDVSTGSLRALALGVTGALGHQPDSVRT